MRRIGTYALIGGMALAMAGYISACRASMADPITDTEVEEAPYWQGVCDGIRATGKYDPNASLAVVALRSGEESEYFGCNGADPAAVADVTLFVHR